MATRASVDDHIHRAEEVLTFAEKQLEEAKKQEHYNEEGYSQAQLELEKLAFDLDTLMQSGNQQQKEQVYRIQLQVREMQQHMILNEF